MALWSEEAAVRMALNFKGVQDDTDRPAKAEGGKSNPRPTALELQEDSPESDDEENSPPIRQSWAAMPGRWNTSKVNAPLFLKA